MAIRMKKHLDNIAILSIEQACLCATKLLKSTQRIIKSFTYYLLDVYMIKRLLYEFSLVKIITCIMQYDKLVFCHSSESMMLQIINVKLIHDTIIFTKPDYVTHAF